jgi:SAM-dependent methyltransferase
MTDLTPEEEITRLTYDKFAAAWAAKHANGDYWVKEFKKFKKLLPAGSILDVGCGFGRDSVELIKLGYSCVGVDISEELLKDARRRVPTGKFYKQSIYDLDLPDKFDGFWAAATLLHIPRTRINKALQSIRSVMNPGAIGFIAVKDGEGEEMEKYEIDADLVMERFYVYWREADFAEVLESNSLEVVDYIYYPENPRKLWHCFFVKVR